MVKEVAQGNWTTSREEIAQEDQSESTDAKCPF